MLINDSATLDLITGMTLEVWVYPTVAPVGWHAILQKEVDAYFLHAGSDKNTPAVGGTFNGVCCQVVYAPDPLAVNTWTHLAGTYDGTQLRLYINGVQVASRAVSGALETNAKPLRLGGNSPYSEYFQGRIDEVRIYNRALSASEIRADMYTPVALSRPATLAEDGTLDLVVLPTGGTVGEGLPTVVSVGQGVNGTVALNANGTVRYTPNSNFNGPDSFTYTVQDSRGETATSVVHVMVTAVNDAPVALPQSATTAEDTPVTITLTGGDRDGDTLTFTLVTEPTHGTVSGTPPLVTYTPTAHFNGTDSFTFRVSDGTETSPPATIAITITPVNDPPTATSASIVTYEDRTSPGITPNVTDVDIATNGEVYTFVVVSPPANGIAAVVSAAQAGQVELSWRAVSYLNLAGYRLYYSRNSSTYESTVDVGNQTTYTLTGLEPGQTYYFTVTAYDAFLNESSFSQELSYQIPRVGQLIYIPHPHYYGLDSFTYWAIDSGGASVLGTAQVTVLAVNDAPVALGQSVTTTEDTAVAITLSGSDVDGDPLTFTIVTGPTQGSLSGVPPLLTYMPNPNVHGTDSFTYIVTDSGGLSATATVTVTVTPVNDAPVALGQSVTTAEGTAAPITLHSSDVDGDALTYTIVTAPVNGTLNGTPPVGIYTPNANFNGTDSFTFRVSDGSLSSSPATVSITRLINAGFERGDFTGWSTIDETRIETAAFGSGPTEGRFQAFLSTAGPAEELGDPVGHAVFVSALETFLELPAGSLDHMSTDAVVEGSAIRRTFTAQAGDVVSFDWNFLTQYFGQF